MTQVGESLIRAAKEAAAIARGKRCDECETEWADYPSKLCPECEAYREHTGAI